MDRDQPIDLPKAEALELLERLEPIADDLILIGGQAVAIWADRYSASSESLRADAPYATKDIDFVGTSELAEQAAHLLGGTCRRFAVGDRTPCAAIVRLSSGTQLDFLRTPLGFTDPEALKKDSVPYAYGRIMHPVDVLQSRVANVGQLEKYQEERSLKQLRAAVTCVREFALDRLDNSPEPQAVKVRMALNLSEQAFRLAGSEDGLAVFARHGIDVADAALVDGRMPEAYRALRVPQQRTQLEAKRLQRERREQSSEGLREKPSMTKSGQGPDSGRRSRRRR